jgi:hypothetical protein
MRPRAQLVTGKELRMKKLRQRVKILGGMKEFVGQLGTIIDYEKDGRTTMYRVRLDVPVEIPNVGEVSDDLWAGSYLRNVRD